MMPVDSIEEWRPAVGCEGLYSVSNWGRVRRDKQSPGARAGWLLKARVSTEGYPALKLRRDGKYIHCKVHILVAEAFLGVRPSPRHVVNHLDGIKTHCHAANLEWTTYRGNIIHARRNGLHVGRAKLTARQVRAIRKLSREWSSQEIGEVFGVRKDTIEDVRNGRTWSYVS